MHAIQSWVALPKGDEETAPAFAHHEGDDLPVHGDRGVWLRLLAGERTSTSAGRVVKQTSLSQTPLLPKTMPLIAE